MPVNDPKVCRVQLEVAIIGHVNENVLRLDTESERIGSTYVKKHSIQ